MAEQTATTSTSGGGSGKTIVMIVGCLLVLCFCCVVTIAGFVAFTVGTALTAFGGFTSGAVCKVSEDNVTTVYLNNTTANFRSTVTEEEFADMSLELKALCGELKGVDTFSAISKGFSVNYSTDNGNEVLDFSGKVGSKNITLKLVSEGDELKIDALTIN